MNTSLQTRDTCPMGAWNEQHTLDYVSKWGELPLHQKIPELCHLKTTDNVLDIGCGSGAAVRAIAEKLTSGQVIGIDPTAKMLEIASTLTPVATRVTSANIDADGEQIRFLLAGAEAIPLNNDSLDLVLAVNSFHHWTDVKTGLNEVLRVLKPLGKFVIIDDIWDEIPEYADQVCPSLPQENEASLNEGVAKELAASMKEMKLVEVIKRTLKEAGFSGVSSREYRMNEVEAVIISGFKEGR
jgi:ubiquinone/menaquinone biosynthesis C-methylase UbiE